MHLTDPTTRLIVTLVTIGVVFGALQGICAQSGTRTTFASLPVTTRTTAYTLRTYVFAATQGTVYTLLYDTESGAGKNQALYDAILGTFRPEYASPACQ